MDEVHRSLKNWGCWPGNVTDENVEVEWHDDLRRLGEDMVFYPTCFHLSELKCMSGDVRIGGHHLLIGQSFVPKKFVRVDCLVYFRGVN